MSPFPSVRSLTLILPLVLVAAGCSDSVSGPEGAGDFDPNPGHALLAAGSPVTLQAEAEVFAPGAPVTLVLDNQSGGVIGYNLCFHAIERRSGDDWTLEPEGRVCTTHLNLLDSGSTAQYETTLPEHLTAGEYRFRVALYLMEEEGHRDQVSASFQLVD